jgi:hypothetical protein
MVPFVFVGLRLVVGGGWRKGELLSWVDLSEPVRLLEVKRRKIRRIKRIIISLAVGGA